MKFKDKLIFVAIACGLFCIWCIALFVLVTATAWLRTVFSIGAILCFVGGLACLRAIGEYNLWMDEETRPIAEAKNRYGYKFRGFWF